MVNTVCLDWLSWTAQKTRGATFPTIPEWEDKFDFREDTPRFGYGRAIKSHSGLVIMFDGSTQNMGFHYIYSGGTLATLGEVFQDGGLRVLKWHLERGHKCTRIDLAIDVKNQEWLLPQLAVLAEQRQFTGSAHGATIVKSSGGRGTTIYIGSRTSERFVRIYDKAAKEGKTGPWVRIEAEVKGDSARAVANAVVGVGAGGISLVARSVISKVCRFDYKGWTEVMEGDTLEIGTPKVEERQTEAWLMGQVATALANFEREYPDKRILSRLFAKVELLLQDN